MKTPIAWHYHRKGCSSCTRALNFMEEHGLSAQETIPASRKLQQTDGQTLAEAATRVIICKGKKVDTFAMEASDPTEVSEKMLGPTGNLRAPTLVVGDTLLVGFNAEIYSDVFSA